MASEKWISREINEKGSFIRQKNQLTTPFGDGDGELPIEAGRYRLIWCQACPWAHRSVIVRRVLGLESVISLGTVDPIRPDGVKSDWAFTLDENHEDPVLKVKKVSELYLNAVPTYTGRFTVPVVVDVPTRKAVNNDYFNLTRYWETVWGKYHKQDAPELYPKNLRDDIDALNDILFDEVNNGVYKVGFARSQEAYLAAFDTLFARLDHLEERLGERRFLFGDYITESDVRLYVTLVRFDVAYVNGFRANLRRIADYPHLWGYVRDLYRTPGFGDTTDFAAIKKHYHLCAIEDNPYRIVPKGPEHTGWHLSHGREKLSSNPQNKFLNLKKNTGR